MALFADQTKPRAMIPFFLHIPKTAGSSIRTLLTRNYTTNEVVSVYGDYNDVLQQSRESIGQVRDKRLIQGHIPHGLHWHFGLRAARYFVFLRHPVMRHFSDVAHALRDPTHAYHDLIKASMDTPQAWAAIGDEAMYFRNTTTQYISGTWFTRDAGLAEYQLAVKNLLDCQFVGLAERFDESVLMMARHLKWQHVVYERHNVTRSSDKVELSTDMIQTCANRLQYDICLYEIACNRFEEDVRQYGAHLQEAAAQLRELTEQQGQSLPGSEHNFYHVGDPLALAEKLERQVRPDSPLGRWVTPEL